MQTSSIACPTAGFFRRLAAWLYDLLVVAALLMLAGGAMMAVLALAQVLGMSIAPYQDISDFLTHHPIVNPLYTAYLACVIGGFYGYFWCKAGQTLGMRAWRLKLQNTDGSNIRPTQAVIRLATACFGLGNLVVIFDINNRAFQDHFAECDMIVLPKPVKNKKN
ncbi:RDD family protein [Salinivibrio kushneri]|uniref:RDD family protein n=1 Tax=Salinivibrio kushneri TaxID=1908198 RepID=UPI0022B53609|nr:RDD family protein [Salinivibrio kushneri]WBA19212.1 RDD family protein [Salinivibrio kushneri]